MSHTNTDGTKKLFVVRYRNRPSYAGMDQYLAAGTAGYVAANNLETAIKFDNLDQAIDSALNKPVMTKGHLPAEVVCLYAEPTTVRYSLGTTI